MQCPNVAPIRPPSAATWCEAAGEPWRCQVHCVTTGREQRLAGLTGLFEFLEVEATNSEPPPKEKRE